MSNGLDAHGRMGRAGTLGWANGNWNRRHRGAMTVRCRC